MTTLLIAVAVLTAGTIATLAFTLRRLTCQLVKTNEQLLVLFAAWKVTPDSARILAGMCKPPQKPLPGIATDKLPEKKEGVTVEYNLGGGL
jgi:hypothetical protein